MDQNNIPIATPVENPTQQKPVQGASSNAIATLILGILSILCMGFVTGVPAIILGSIELKAIKAGKSPTSGETPTKVGYILGIIGTVLTCLSIFAVIVAVVLGMKLNFLGNLPNAVGSV